MSLELPTRASWIPTVELSDASFQARHRVLRMLLWLQLPLVIAVGLATGEATGQATAMHAEILWTTIGGVAGCAVAAGLAQGRRTRAVVTAIGLLLSAVALVHGGGGLTDLHFHFFVVLALISLYQDWLPFLIAVLLVAVHHLGLGLLMPTMVFSDPRAQRNPLLFALLHAAFVLAMCCAQVAYWRFSAAAQGRADIERQQVAAAAEEELTDAIRAAEQRAAEEARRAGAELERNSLLATQLEGVLANVAATGQRLGREAGDAINAFDTAVNQAGATVDIALHRLDGTVRTAESAVEAITELGAALSEIASIAGLIQSVADQTNLLALNATIEAARAGEVGKGFAVVASEVKELAAQTASATARIESTVSDVQSRANTVAEAVREVAAGLGQLAETQRNVGQVMAEQQQISGRTRDLVLTASAQVASAADAVTGLQ